MIQTRAVTTDVRAPHLVAALWTAIACNACTTSDAVLGIGAERDGASPAAQEAGTIGFDAAGAGRPSGDGAATPDNADGGFDSGDAARACGGPVTFADPDVDTAVRQAIGVPSGPIHAADVAGITDLYLLTAIVGAAGPLCPPDAGTPSSFVAPCTDRYNSPPIADGWTTSLGGVECLPSLRSLSVDPFLLDLTPLANLPNLTTLWFGPALEPSFPSLPQVTTIRAALDGNTIPFLSAFPSLISLDASGADFSTAAARAGLSALTSLTTLSAPQAGLTDTLPLGGLTRLADVNLANNAIADISSLVALPALRSLDVSGNRITDLSPLADNPGFGAGSAIDISGNPLDCMTQQANIATLRARLVTVVSDCP
jgi:internalin A